MNVVLPWFYAGLTQQVNQHEIDTGPRPDTPALKRPQITGSNVQVARHYQLPVHTLGQCHQQSCSAPAGKGLEHGMGAVSRQIDFAVAQGVHGLWVDELDIDIETFVVKIPELNRGDSGEVGVRDEIGHTYFHILSSRLK